MGNSNSVRSPPIPNDYMSSVLRLKKIAFLLVVCLSLNIFWKLIRRSCLEALSRKLQTCSAGECNTIMWWQKFPFIEKLIWTFIDDLEI